MASDDYEESPDAFHTRVLQIQDVSDTIAIANLQLQKLLSTLGWDRESLTKKEEHELCPIDENHALKKKNMKSHLTICLARKHGLESFSSKDVRSSPVFAYENCKGVTPVFIGKEEYAKLGIELDELKDWTKDSTFNLNQSQADQSLVDDAIESNVNGDGVNETLHETNEEINSYTPTDPLDCLRFIYSWCAIPKQYQRIDFTKVDSGRVKNWLVENLPKTKKKMSLEADVQLVTLIYEWLQDPAVAYPDGMLQCLKEIFDQDARPFVLQLWKFFSATRLCEVACIPEITRKEFEFYSLSMNVKGDPRKGSAESDVHSLKERVSSSGDSTKHEGTIDLPMEWVFCNVKPSDRLAIYDHVVGVGKLLKSDNEETSASLVTDLAEQGKVIDSWNVTDDKKSKLDEIAELRNYKRRRQTYRGKNAAKRKLKRIEVLREQVEQHMMYAEMKYWNENPAPKQERHRSRSPQDDGLDERERVEKDQHRGRRSDRRARSPRRSSSRDRGRRRSRRSNSRDKNNRDRESRENSQEKGSNDRDERRSKSREKSEESSKDRRNNSKRDRSKGRRSRSRDRSRSIHPWSKRYSSRRSRSRDRASSSYGRRHRSRDRHRRSKSRERDRERDRSKERGRRRSRRDSDEGISNITYYEHIVIKKEDEDDEIDVKREEQPEVAVKVEKKDEGYEEFELKKSTEPIPNGDIAEKVLDSM